MFFPYQVFKSWGNALLEENIDVSLLIFQSLKGKIVFFLFVEERY